MIWTAANYSLRFTVIQKQSKTLMDLHQRKTAHFAILFQKNRSLLYFNCFKALCIQVYLSVLIRLSGFGVVAMLATETNCEGFSFLFIFIGIILPLNVWQNLQIKPCGPGIFFFI